LDKDFLVTILSPEKKLYEGRVVSLIAPCSTGYWGILANHTPLIATLSEGKIIVREKPDTEKVFYCKGRGFLEVLKNTVNVLAASVYE